eukprot:5219806-Karenia_brevis.AAC.1
MMSSMAAMIAAKKELDALRNSGELDSDDDLLDDSMDGAAEVTAKADDTLENLKETQISLTRQIAALKGLTDGRSVETVKKLQQEVTEVRHKITLCKPPSQQ